MTLTRQRRPLTGRLRSNWALRRLRHGSRAKRQNRRWPGVVLWLLGLVAAASALIGLAHLHANPPEEQGQFPDPALATLAQTGVALFAAFGVIVFMTWCVRRIRLEFLSWWPGRIVVHTFEADDEKVPAPERERLTAGFRDRLGMSHLQSPAPTPAPAEQGAFLDVLAGAQFDPQNPLTSVVSLLRAASPSHAYEVRGALVTGDGPRDKGVTVHVVRHPGKGAGGHTVWDTTWDGAMRQAADHAAASILPRTRVCRSPWAGWRRYYLPTSLFEAYERAAELEHDRRYDEALHLYLKAVGEDPKNLALRLQLGFLQEKLALYLDALDTYQSILQIGCAETLDDEHADASGEVRKPARLAARRERKRAERVTRYRRAVLLGGGELARQWGKWGPRTKTRRDKERDRLRERLEPGLEKLFEAALCSRAVREKAFPIYDDADRIPPPRAACASALRKPKAAGAQRTTDELEQLLLLASLHELDRLQSDLPRYPIRRTSLTRATVQVSSLVVEARLRWVVNGSRCQTDREWKHYIKTAQRKLDRIEGGREFDRWQEHYNAACIYALPLLATDNLPEAAAERLTILAVRRLESAVEKADSAYLASRRDWLVSEDPDLRGLRNETRFKRFEAAYLPSPARAPRRPVSVHKWEVSRYTLALLRATAQRWEDVWEMRRTKLNGNSDVRTMLRWFRDEGRAWRLMREVAINHRDWESRHKLLDQMRQWTAEYSFEPMRVAFSRFSADDEAQLRGKERGGRGRDVERATIAAIRDKDLRLKGLAGLLDEASGREARDGFRVDDELKAIRKALGRLEAGGEQLPAEHVAKFCGAEANLWRRAGALLEPEEARLAAEQDVRLALAAAKEAWTTLRGDSGLRTAPPDGGDPETLPRAA
jgi:hypothetical protein